MVGEREGCEGDVIYWIKRDMRVKLQEEGKYKIFAKDKSWDVGIDDEDESEEDSV